MMHTFHHINHLCYSSITSKEKLLRSKDNVSLVRSWLQKAVVPSHLSLRQIPKMDFPEGSGQLLMLANPCPQRPRHLFPQNQAMPGKEER